MSILLRVLRRAVPAPPPPEEPDSDWTFHDLGADTGTSGSVDGAGNATLGVRGGEEKTEGGFLYQTVTGGDTQIITKFDGFTGTLQDFTAAFLGVRQSTEVDVAWAKLVKHNIGRLPAKVKPAPGAEVETTQGDDLLDTEPYLGFTFSLNEQLARMWKAPTLAALNDIEQRELVAEHSLTLSAPYLRYVGGASNNDANLVGVSFSELAVSNTITLTKPAPPPPGPDPDDEVIIDNGQPFGSDFDAVYPGAWPTVDTLVYGRDWTLPPDIAPAARSGIWFYDSGSTVPGNFPGTHLKHIKGEWRGVEPTQGNYNFSGIINQINDASAGHDGAILHMRGFVHGIDFDGGSPAYASKRTCPEFLANQDTVQEKHFKTFRVTQLKISDPQVLAAVLNMIQAFGASGIPANPRLKAANIHGVSHTLGEEWTGAQTDGPGTAAMAQIAEAWLDAYGPHAYKLAWNNSHDEIWNTVKAAGGGSRHARGDMWLKSRITIPGHSDNGTLLTRANGTDWFAANAAERAETLGWYLDVDESAAQIAGPRHFGDALEKFRPGNFSDLSTTGPEKNWPLRFCMSWLRMLQGRRNIIAGDDDLRFNPHMANWASLELGRKVNDAPDAWVALIRTWAYFKGADREINNLERWLNQRDDLTGATTPTIKRDHGYNPDGNALASTLRYVNLARRPNTGTGIGIAVKPQFLTVGAPHNVAIKVTFLDSGTGTWTLRYREGATGTISTKDQGKGNTGKVRTRTFFIPELYAGATGGAATFSLESTTTDFMFVRVVKKPPGGWPS